MLALTILIVLECAVSLTVAFTRLFRDGKGVKRRGLGDGGGTRVTKIRSTFNNCRYQLFTSPFLNTQTSQSCLDLMLLEIFMHGFQFSIISVEETWPEWTSSIMGFISIFTSGWMNDFYLYVVFVLAGAWVVYGMYSHRSIISIVGSGFLIISGGF